MPVSAVETQCLPLAVVRSWLQLQFVNVQCWFFDEVFYLCCLRQTKQVYYYNRPHDTIYHNNTVLATAE